MNLVSTSRFAFDDDVRSHACNVHEKIHSR